MHTEKGKSLAWGCVQLHCEENAFLDENKRRDRQSTTAVTKSKHAIYSSEPTILFCDISIQAGKNQQFRATHRIPILGYPPTYKASDM